VSVQDRHAVMNTKVITLHDEDHCDALESFLVDRIYDFNSQATGYFDGKMLGGSLRSEAGEIIAGFSGHTWGGCCEISHLWVSEQHRGRGLGTALLQAAEREARHRGCERVILATHSFQAPAFYERLGYERKYIIEGQPLGYSNIIYAKILEARDDI
jgi:GNAT superfamily N-acetyltransferase